MTYMFYDSLQVEEIEKTLPEVLIFKGSDCVAEAEYNARGFQTIIVDPKTLDHMKSPRAARRILYTSHTERGWSKRFGGVYFINTDEDIIKHAERLDYQCLKSSLNIQKKDL